MHQENGSKNAEPCGMSVKSLFLVYRQSGQEGVERAKLKNGILYMGDSEGDNPTFEASGIGLGVIHEDTQMQSLVCEYFVEFEEVPSFLSRLLANHLLFGSNFRMIRVNSNRMRVR